MASIGSVPKVTGLHPCAPLIELGVFVASNEVDDLVNDSQPRGLFKLMFCTEVKTNTAFRCKTDCLFQSDELEAEVKVDRILSGIVTKVTMIWSPISEA